MTRNLLFLMRRPPYAGIRVQEALEAAMVGAAFDQRLSLLFKDDGVWQLRKGQNGALVGAKTLLKTLRALPEYDVHQLYACSASLNARGLVSADLGLPVTALSLVEQQTLLAAQDQVLTD